MNGTRVASDISRINPQQASPCGRFNPYLYARILFSHLFLIYYSHCNIRRNVLKSDKRIFPDKGRDRNFLRRFGRVADFSVKSLRERRKMKSEWKSSVVKFSARQIPTRSTDRRHFLFRNPFESARLIPVIIRFPAFPLGYLRDEDNAAHSAARIHISRVIIFN